MAKHDKRVKYQSEADKPVMLSLRVPRELNERLERYASLHRQKVSALVRDAIEMRLEVEADPRSPLPKSPADAPLMQIDGASLLRDVRRMVQQEFEAFCESRTALLKSIDQAQRVPDTVTDTQSQPDEAALEAARLVAALRAPTRRATWRPMSMLRRTNTSRRTRRRSM